MHRLQGHNGVLFAVLFALYPTSTLLPPATRVRILPIGTRAYLSVYVCQRHGSRGVSIPCSRITHHRLSFFLSRLLSALYLTTTLFPTVTCVRILPMGTRAYIFVYVCKRHGSRGVSIPYSRITHHRQGTPRPTCTTGQLPLKKCNQSPYPTLMGGGLQFSPSQRSCAFNYCPHLT